MRHVVLIGFMAAGKSTVGRRLADELGRPFVDTDALVVATYGPIEQIFAEHGEARFRELEREVIAQALAGPPSVIAVGGGAVTHAPTRELLAGGALRVYLRIEPQTILRRVRRTSVVRPVLGREPTIGRIRELLAAREPFYREAELALAPHGASPRAYARAIADAVRAHEAARHPAEEGALP